MALAGQLRRVLDDHVDGHVLLGELAEDLGHDARAIFDADEHDARLALVVGDPRDDHLLERGLARHEGALRRGEARTDVNGDLVLHR